MRQTNIYILDGPTFDELLKTLNPSGAKRNETWEEQSVPVSVYPLCYAVWPLECL